MTYCHLLNGAQPHAMCHTLAMVAGNNVQILIFFEVHVLGNRHVTNYYININYFY